MKNDQIEIYKKRLEAEKQFIKKATEKAVQQRMFTVWCIFIGVPAELVAYMIQSAYRSLSYIEKMNKSLSRLEKTIYALESVSSIVEQDIVTKLNKLYRKKDALEYDDFLERIKLEGIKVYRNSNGEHQIKWN